MIARDNYYELEVLRKDGTLLGVDSIEKAFWDIVEDAQKVDGAGVGVLSSDQRDTWTQTREHLLSVSPVNRKTINSIEDLCVIITSEPTQQTRRLVLGLSREGVDVLIPTAAAAGLATARARSGETVHLRTHLSLPDGISCGSDCTHQLFELLLCLAVIIHHRRCFRPELRWTRLVARAYRCRLSFSLGQSKGI